MASPPPWPFMDFDGPLSPLLQGDHHHHHHQLLLQGDHPHPHPQLLQHQLQAPPLLAAPQSSTPLSPSQLLSSQNCISSPTAKVSKRKSRAARKPPIQILSTDRENFRDMVQQLTGIPMDLQARMRPWAAAAGGDGGAANFPGAPTALYRPMPIRQRSGFPSDLALVGMAHQTMRTLDTSSAYLSKGLRHGQSLGQDEAGKRDFYMGYGADEASAAAMPEVASYGEAGDVLPELESYIMSSSKLEELLLQQPRIDPWLPSHVEITHSV